MAGVEKLVTYPPLFNNIWMLGVEIGEKEYVRVLFMPYVKKADKKPIFRMLCHVDGTDLYYAAVAENNSAEQGVTVFQGLRSISVGATIQCGAVSENWTKINMKPWNGESIPHAQDIKLDDKMMPQIQAVINAALSTNLLHYVPRTTPPPSVGTPVARSVASTAPTVTAYTIPANFRINAPTDPLRQQWMLPFTLNIEVDPSQKAKETQYYSQAWRIIADGGGFLPKIQANPPPPVLLLHCLGDPECYVELSRFFPPPDLAQRLLQLEQTFQLQKQLLEMHQ